jgi:hypothetical protein
MDPASVVVVGALVAQPHFDLVVQLVFGKLGRMCSLPDLAFHNICNIETPRKVKKSLLAVRN